MKKMHRILSVVSSLILSSVVALISTNCTTTPEHVPAPGPRVSIMSMNVENLFDTKHDPGKDDHTFLPLALKQSNPEFKSACEKNDSDYRRKECLETDWSENALKVKMERISQVMRQVGNGRGPDIQLFVEVENKNVLEMLRTQYLADLDYKTSILIEGPDNRGIDTAILSRLPEWGEPKLHTITFKHEGTTEEIAKQRRELTSRGILEARLILPGGQKASVFAVHFPSQGNPGFMRRQAVERLNQLQKELPKDVIAIAGGDFNITAKEDLETGLYSKTLQTNWLISHQIGCKGCEGTHYYNPEKSWSFLDALLFQTSMKTGGGSTWIVDAGSIRIPNALLFQVNKYGSPLRFNERSTGGVSDHWPIYGEIYLPQPAAQQ